MRSPSASSISILLAAVGTALVSVTPIWAWSTVSNPNTFVTNAGLVGSSFVLRPSYRSVWTSSSSPATCPSLNRRCNWSFSGNTALRSSITDDRVETSAAISTQSATGDDETAETQYDPYPHGQHQELTKDEIVKKVINGLILAVSFGYAAYTIFNIDHGMTRGWTQGEIAMRIPLDNWNNYETALSEKPIYTKTLINVVIYLLGDWLSQTVFQKKNLLDFDPWRVLRNGLIGLGFGPLVHEYYQFSDHILPVEGGLLNRFEKIIMDQTIYLAVKCSMYICAVGMLSGEEFGTCKQTVKDRLPNIMVTAWKFWPLVHCVTYGAIPARHRILWVNCVDLVWNAILATITNGKKQEDVAVEETSDVAVAALAEENSTATPQTAFAAISADADEAATRSDPFLMTHDMIPETLAPLFTNENELRSILEETSMNAAADEYGNSIVAGNSTVGVSP